MGELLNMDKELAVVAVSGGLDSCITTAIASKEYNQKLSEKRADAVSDYIIKKGIAADRVSKKGFGLKKPIAPNNSKEGRAKNRRVQLMPIK